MDSEKEYIKKAVTLHGHYGPSLMLGVKACLYAKSVLGDVSKCVAETIVRKPYLCALDGVKACSKCDISVEEGEGLSFTFFNGSQKLRMSLKTALLQEYYNRYWNELEHLADEVVSKDALDLFDVTKT
ncbi:MAG: FmdE family protein [Nitrososphaeria archaeon]|jgi:hypothetical protein